MAIVRGNGDGRGGWMPRCDVFGADGHDLVIEAELPGLSRDDIEVRMEEGRLTLRGARTVDGAQDGRTYRRVERRAGAFERAFALPGHVDGAEAKAEYADGVLTITLPVKSNARPRQIPVESAA